MGLSSISLPEPYSESYAMEIAPPLPLFKGVYWGEVRLVIYLVNRLYGKVGGGSLGGEES